jgi:GNAT superfamily N-acetyltransferase
VKQRSSSEGAAPAAPPHIRTYRPGDGPAFRRLNEAWILQFFELEENDRATLGDPENTILARGGEILMAEAASTGESVGCCALIRHGESDFELVKMAVALEWQGRGIGRLILQAAIDKARERGARRIYLESNSKLLPALRLYESCGFRYLPAPEEAPSKYKRVDVWMELLL